MDFYKVFNIENNAIMVRKGMSLEPDMTIKLRKVVSVPSVTIHWSIELNNQIHFFDNITFCDEELMDKVYDDMDEAYCIDFMERSKINFAKSLIQLKYGINEN